MSENRNHWKTAFWVVLIVLILAVVRVLSLASNNINLENSLKDASSRLIQLTSGNAQSQQKCIGDANQAYHLDPMQFYGGIQSAINACQVEYPTN